MLPQLVQSGLLSPASLFLGLCALPVVWWLWVTVQNNARVRKTGGVRAVTPFNAFKVFYDLARAQSEDKMFDFWAKHWDVAAKTGDWTFETRLTPVHRFVITRDPEVVKTVLTTKFAQFGKGDDFHRLWSPFLGDSVFSTDGQVWHESRSLVRPMFIKDRVSDLAIFEHGARNFMAQLPPSGETVQLMDLLYRATLDITVEFLLGEELNSLQNPRSSFVEAFSELQRIQFRIATLAPFDKFMSRKDYYRHIQTLDDFIVPFIEKTLALPSDEVEKLGKSDHGFTFLHGLASLTRDPKVIRDQLVAVLLAGRDTTAGTLSWAFYELAAYPEKWKRLRDEVLSALGHNEPTYQDLKDMKYLRYVLQETLRLYPAVPYNVRTALEDTTIPGRPGKPDIAVLKDDPVAYSPFMLQRNRALYPPTSEDFADPLIFSPERWYTWQPKSWEFIPFNGGPRICVGQNFAMTEMAYFLVRIVQRYERLEYRGDWHAQLHQADIVGRPKFGVPIALYEEKEARSS